MILADNVSAWFLSGAPDERGDNGALRDLRRLRLSDFKAVDASGLTVDPDSGRAASGERWRRPGAAQPVRGLGDHADSTNCPAAEVTSIRSIRVSLS